MSNGRSRINKDYHLGRSTAAKILYKDSETLRRILDETIHSGVLDVISVTDAGGLNITWTAGEIYTPAGVIQETDASAGAQACTDDAINYLVWTAGSTLTLRTTPADPITETSVAHIQCQEGDIWSIHVEPVITDIIPSLQAGLGAVAPILVESGIIVTEDVDATNDLDVAVSAGIYWQDGHFPHDVNQYDTRTANTLVRCYIDGAGPETWDFTAGQHSVDIANWNNGVALVGVSANKYYKGLFVVSGDNVFWIYAQEQHNTIASAIEGELPSIPAGISLFPRCTAYIYKGGETTFQAASTNRWIDVRPRVGVAIPGSLGGAFLENVVDDTSPQLGGNLDVNGNSIVSAANGDINITPNGMGDLILGGVTIDDSDNVSGMESLLMADNKPLKFGTGDDARIQWDDGAQDSLQIGVNVGFAGGSGYVSIMDRNDLGQANREPAASSADPVLRVFSADETQAADYLDLFHDQTDACMGWGNGLLKLEGRPGSPATSGVTQNGILRLVNVTNDLALDFGQLTASPYTSWIQNTDKTDLSVEYPLVLNPNGGNVGIGTTDPKQAFDFDGADTRTQRQLDTALNTNLGDQTFGAGALTHAAGNEGWYNNAFGAGALYSISSGYGNCAFGSGALVDVTEGQHNSGMGYCAGWSITTGDHNICLGYKAGNIISTGDKNISIGAYSNYTNALGHRNIIIGYDIDAPSTTGSDQLNIGNILYGDMTARTKALELVGVASAVNHVKITNAATTVGPTIESEGETNVPLYISAKGTGRVVFLNTGSGSTIEIQGGNVFHWREDNPTKNALYTFHNTATYGSEFDCRRSRGTQASKTQVVSGDFLGGFSAWGWKTVGTDQWKEAARVRIYADGTPASGGVPGRIEFQTGTTSASPASRFAIYTGGNSRVVGSNHMEFLDADNYIYAGSADDLYAVCKTRTRMKVGAATKFYINVSGVAFNGQVPAAPPNYTVSNYTPRRTYDAAVDGLAELQDFVCTMAADIILNGLFQ